MANMTGERPVKHITPDSVLALHSAGYREIARLLGQGLCVDLGCGEGFETSNLASDNRFVIGIDYSMDALRRLRENYEQIKPVLMDCTKLGLADRSVDYISSSHVIEHFVNPGLHVRECARVLKHSGTAIFITPKKSADFENPFHIYLFEPEDLKELLLNYFESVQVHALEGSERVKEEIRSRRERAKKIYGLDKWELRKKIPRDLWIFIYSRLLPWAQKVVYRDAMNGKTGINDNDFFLANAFTEDSPAILAVCKRPISVIGHF